MLAVMMSHPFIPIIGGILIRKEYGFALQAVNRRFHAKLLTGMVVFGHPEIEARQPMVFQRDAKMIYGFSGQGVSLWYPRTGGGVVPSGTWALVASNAEALSPAS
ncbi:hypothetical protein FRB98_006206 [Tulasnella sp. 332]|nr:hypothetical protein FRB98_006206 [Tulasnella sp. 332]